MIQSRCYINFFFFWNFEKELLCTLSLWVLTKCWNCLSSEKSLIWLQSSKGNEEYIKIRQIYIANSNNIEISQCHETSCKSTECCMVSIVSIVTSSASPYLLGLSWFNSGLIDKQYLCKLFVYFSTHRFVTTNISRMTKKKM